MQTKETVRVGIIGPSWWVDFWHLPAIQNHPNAVITAICGEKPRDENEVREKYGPEARYFTDRAAMLASGLCDGVIVCTPNDLHGPVTLDALNAGLHITCEKPIAMNANEAQAMAELATSCGLIGMSNFPYRDNPAVEAMRHLAAGGAIGKLLHLSGIYNGGFGLTRPPGWRGSKTHSGAGILGDLGSHLIDLARFVTGDEFRSVCAHTLTLDRAESADAPGLIRTEDARAGDRNDDSCAFLAEMASGAQGLFQTSWIAYQGAMGQHQEIELAGTGGRLHFVANHLGTILRHLPVGEQRWQPVEVAGIITPALAEGDDQDYFRPGRHTPSNTTYRWIEAIRTGQSHVSPDLTDGWQTQRVIDAILAASRERRWIEV